MELIELSELQGAFDKAVDPAQSIYKEQVETHIPVINKLAYKAAAQGFLFFIYPEPIPMSVQLYLEAENWKVETAEGVSASGNITYIVFPPLELPSNPE